MTRFMTMKSPTPSPVERLAEPDRWTPPEDTDAEALMAAARRERDEAIAALLRRGARGIARLWQMLIAKPFAAWVERERTIRELSSLHEHELAELGIAPGMIPYVASGKFRSDERAAAGSSTVANENTARIRRVA